MVIKRLAVRLAKSRKPYLITRWKKVNRRKSLCKEKRAV
ncbi:Uncharacterised protein [Vibrio cholerae]|nr:Uncharacterised protein [Vibrio cholerae]